MKSVPSYSRVESNFDLDEEINSATNETKKFIEEIKQSTDTDEQYKAILKACISEFVEKI